MRSKGIELLAPAKNLKTAQAAIDHGADAIYIGSSAFGARSSAVNSIEDIAQAVEYAHLYGAKIYATLNTLIYDDEIDAARANAQSLLDIGVDALIIQDLAYLRMGLHSDRGVEFHASTQMCNMSVEGVKFLQEVGFRRVVLERNLSLEEMRQIANAAPEVDLEAFIHGAICVGYSGQCYLSRSQSARSGNRGECSQPCRLSYDLIDGKGEKILSRRHLLSVKDLNLSAKLGDLLDLGVSSFKIEGRLKDINYIKNVVAHYRQLLDREMSQREGLYRASTGVSNIEFTPNPAKSFSRGESSYLIDGKRGSVASFESPKAMGEMVGEVIELRGSRRVVVETNQKLSNGDGVCFTTNRGVVGASINGVERAGATSQLITLSSELEIKLGDRLYRNLDRRFELAIDSSRTKRRIRLNAEFSSSSNGLKIRYIDQQGEEVTIEEQCPLEPTKNLERMAQIIDEQLSKCGDTIFECMSLDKSGWGGEFIPSALLAKIRREALDKLRERRLQRANEQSRDNFVESSEARYPSRELTGETGVTNHLAESFYREHGVELISRSIESYEEFEGVKVMESSYCLRNEIGECLKRGSQLSEPLYIEHGAERYRLKFDCKECRMALIKESR